MRYIPTILAYTLVLILSVINIGVLPKTDVPSADKIVHTIMYFGITLTLMLNQTSYLHKKITKSQLHFAFLFSIGFGTLMEIIQHFLPWRSGSIYDFIANTLGVIIGTAVFLFLQKLNDKKFHV